MWVVLISARLCLLASHVSPGSVQDPSLVGIDGDRQWGCYRTVCGGVKLADLKNYLLHLQHHILFSPRHFNDNSHM